MEFRWCIINSKWEVIATDGTFGYRVGVAGFCPLGDELFERWGPYIMEPVWHSAGSTPTPERKQPEGADVVTASDDSVMRESEVVVLQPTYVLEYFKYVGSKRPNDCAVVTAANCFSLDYKVAKVACFHCGWSSVSGIDDGMINRVAVQLGFTTTYRKDLSRGYVGDFAADGVFIVTCPQHIMPAINGKIYNVGAQAHDTIEDVYEVHPMETE